MSEFNLISSSLKEGDFVPNHHVYNGLGCHGDNVSPALKWEGAPRDTKSFAVTVFDPDAPTDHGWWHWTVVNIPASITELKEGASQNGLPSGAMEIMTDFHKTNYGGPCPPKGTTHRYVFTVYALKTDKLNVGPTSNPIEVKDRIQKESLAEASFTVKYGR